MLCIQQDPIGHHKDTEKAIGRLGIQWLIITSDLRVIYFLVIYFSRTSGPMLK